MKLKLKKGLDLNIAGAVSNLNPIEIDVKLFAISPSDYPGFTPKLDVKEGDTLMSGSPIMHDKVQDTVKLVSPVAGTVKAVVRGERRKIIRVEIEKSEVQTSRKFDLAPNYDFEQAMRLMAESGLLAQIRQRPFDVVPDPTVAPRDIFVTTFDSAPLAVPFESTYDFTLADLDAAVKFLKAVCKGNIYVSTRNTWPFKEIAETQMVEIAGPHPAGNPGIQAANIAPVNKGETIWTLSAITLAKIGKLVNSGIRDTKTTVAVTGPELDSPMLASTFEGAAVKPLLHAADLKNAGHNIRIISGNAICGTSEKKDGFIHFPYRQLTVIAEGDDKTEFMGWASFSPSKSSVSPTFPGHFMKKAFAPDARLNGGKRAMIMSGEYDRVMPMDILSEYLLKAILSRNIEQMEKLGIYEIAPEDFALPEYVDTSKLPIQQIVRDGLDFLREALN